YRTWAIRFPYEQTGDVQRIISTYDGRILEQRYDDAAHLAVSFRYDLSDTITARFEQLHLVELTHA
ncbi:MAG: DUF1949 domain-containing protein, partial [Catalinimonas sp.]